MRVAIVGASGFIGRQLVPRLTAKGFALRLFGRDLARLKALFPDEEVAGYGDLAADLAGQLEGVDALIHLAVLNSDADARDHNYFDVNVTFLDTMLQAAATAGVPHIVLTSSAHAETPQRSAYAASKREAEDHLAAWAGETPGRCGDTLRLPPVYGERFAGRLARLNALPTPLRRLAGRCVGALTPLLSIDRLADAIGETLRADPAGHPASTCSFLSDGQAGNTVYAVTRRTVDALASLAGLALLALPLAGVWLAIRLTSPGPGLFVQTRIGRGEKSFACLKLRTMATGTGDHASHLVGDAAITPIGRFLRRTKLDELPQLWNVLRGEQSLVGPRPCLPNQAELIAERRRHHIFDHRPGITGWAQMHQVDMRDPERLVALEADYAMRRSLILDAKILLATLVGRGIGDAAARKEPPPQGGGSHSQS